MRFSTKVDNSYILSEKLVDKEKLNIYTKKNKLKQLIVFIIMFIYTIYNNFVVKQLDFILISTIILAINLGCLFLLNLFSNTYLSLHHKFKYEILLFISRTSKLLVLLFAIFSSIKNIDLYKDTIIKMIEYYKNLEEYNLNTLISNVYLENTLLALTLIINIILLLVLLIIYIIKYIKYVPPIGIGIYLYWLFYNNRIFYEYKDSKSIDKALVVKRKLYKKYSRYFKVLGKKILISILFSLVVISILYYIYTNYLDLFLNELFS